MKHKIFSHTSLLIILSVILTFLAAGTVMYNRYDIYMKQGVRDEAAYIKTGLEEDGDVFSRQTGSETPPVAGSLFWEKMVRCCLTVLRIRKKWKIIVTDRNLLKLRSRDQVRWYAIQTPYQNRRLLCCKIKG